MTSVQKRQSKKQTKPKAIPRGQELKVEWVPIGKVKINPRNARDHSDRQVKEIAASIKRFGFNNPLKTDGSLVLIAGEGRLKAATLLEMARVPVIKLTHLSEMEKRAYALADNKIPENSGWNVEKLRKEVRDILGSADFGLETLGFRKSDLKGLRLGDAGDSEETVIAEAMQLEPEREYMVIVCDDPDEWEALKEKFGLGPVRKGGYPSKSAFAAIGTERVITAARVLKSK